MQAKLIGWPYAGGLRSGYGSKSKSILANPLSGGTGHGQGVTAGAGPFLGPFLIGAESVTVGKSVLPSVVFASGGYGVGGMVGDVTGKHKGKGQGAGGGMSPGHGSATLRKVTYGPRGGRKFKVLAKRKGYRGKGKGKGRAVGVELFGAPILPGDKRAGKDGAFSLFLDAPLFEDKRQLMAWVLGQDIIPDAFADRLLMIGRRAAARQARQIAQRRGVRPSDTSIQDAASDAVCALLTHARRLDKATAAHWESVRFIRQIWRWAGRAAFNSFASWACLGIKGKGARLSNLVAELTYTAGGHADSIGDGKANPIEELTIHAANKLAEQVQAAHAESLESNRAARLAAVRFVWRVAFGQFTAGLPADMRGAARAATVRAARARCHVLQRVLLGADYDAACNAGGFGSVRNFSESADKAGLWRALSKASATRPNFAADWWQGMARAWAIDASDTLRKLRAMGVGGWECERFPGSPLQAGAAIAVRRLLAERAEQVGEAVACRKAWQAARAADAAAWERVRHGLTSGKFDSLQRAMVGKRKGSARKVDANRILRPRGKVARPVPDWCAALEVVTKHGARVLACAPSAS